MRVYFKLTPNNQFVPFDYQRNLVGAFHKWLGENELHDEVSLYSLSWLEGGNMRRDKKGLDFPNGAVFFVSSPLSNLHTQTVEGMFQDETICWGMKVEELSMKRTPDFGDHQTFVAQSPILIKRKLEEDSQHRYFYPADPESNDLLTETLQLKLQRLNLPDDVQVAFDNTYLNPRIKKIRYQGLDIKAALCPVVVSGHPRAVQAAWEVGVGNSTGIGFGALW